MGQTRQIYEERRLNFLNQILGGIKEVKIYNTEAEFIKNYLSLLLTITLFIPLSIVSVIFEFIAVIFKKGGIIRIVIQKI